MEEKTIKWRNLRNEPPTKNCNICLKVGDNYETYKFLITGSTWALTKFIGHTYPSSNIPAEAEYIILNNIK